MTRAAFTLAILLGASGVASAQDLPALTVDPLSVPRATPPVPPGNSLLDPTPILVERPDSTDARYRLSLDVGFPTGIRIGRQLGESRFWGEVGLGVWWIVPYVSTALRYDCRLYDGASDCLAVRPSLSATVVPIFTEGVFGCGADVEFVWQHRFANGFATDFGFRIGATALFGPWSRDDHVPVVPVVALVFAAQF